MADLILGPAGRPIVLDSPLCVKTGQPTTERVTIKGSTEPGWVPLLFVFSFIGMLIAGAMTSRRYAVSLPFSHVVHDRWQRTNRAAWAIALLGGVVIVFGAVKAADYSFFVSLTGVAITVVGIIIGTVNASQNNVGFGLTRDNELVLRRAHPDFVASLTHD